MADGIRGQDNIKWQTAFEVKTISKATSSGGQHRTADKNSVESRKGDSATEPSADEVLAFIT
jgi:hypothetical protein